MMRREDRAKQFAPFEALGSLREALKKVELKHERVERIEVDEDRADKINRALVRLERGTHIKATCYSDGFYVDIDGRVEAVDLVFKYIKLGSGKIYFDDIYDIRVL